ncbi:MAG: patatin-like phospholipase family protein [Magnetospirillum sp. WYHS-4]
MFAGALSGCPQLPKELAQAEWAALCERRRQAGRPAEEDLAGLAISGGGIRSASFALGVIQALHRFGLFKRFDYLSTVSGGGYTGSCLTVNLVKGDGSFPFGHEAGKDESPLFRHLRDKAAYLTPKSLLEAARMPALALYGMSVNFLALLPIVLFLAWFTALVSKGFLEPALHSETMAIPIETKRVCGGKMNGDCQIALRIPWELGWVAKDERIPNLALTDIPAGVRILRGTETVSVRTDRGWADFYATDAIPDVALDGDLMLAVPRGMVGDFSLRATVWPKDYPLGENPHTRLHDVTVRLVAYALGPFLSAILLYLVAAALARFGAVPARGNWRWLARDRASRYILALGFLLSLAFMAAAVQPLAIYHFDVLAEKLATPSPVGDAGKLSAVVTALGALLASPFLQGFLDRKPSLASKVAVAVIGVLGPLTLWLLYLNATRWALAPESVPDTVKAIWKGIAAPLGLAEVKLGIWPYLIVAVMLSWTMGRLFDANQTSLHRFYRDRLSKAFLFFLGADGKVHHDDDLALSAANSPCAPYHLVNTAVNLQASRQANPRGRNAEPFLFSPRYVGCPTTGYIETPLMEAEDSHVNLGTAMAISGAAFSPNMGNQTRPLLTFLLSLLNVRLGYWLPNPEFVRRKAAKPAWRRRLENILGMLPGGKLIRGHPGMTYLVREMMGTLDERSRFVNVSDGGHIENLALYELLRRECPLILAIDGEEDGNYTFEGLANAVRLARIDFGIMIDIDVEHLRPGPGPEVAERRPCWDREGMSQVHFAVGTIHYREGRTGLLLYVKSSLTGDEDIHIQEYRCKNPDFPHQTTMDQFFDEAQFEAYRALGHHVGKEVFSGNEDERLRKIVQAGGGATPTAMHWKARLMGER